MGRRKAMALLIGGVLVGGLVALRAWGIAEVERALTAQGFQWTDRQDAPLAVRWLDLSGPRGTADRLAVRAGWPVSVTVQAPELDLQSWPGSRPAGGGESLIPVSVWVEDLTVRWGDRTLLTGLSGPLRPKIALAGPGGTLGLETLPDGTQKGTLTATLDLDLPEIRGRAEVSVRAAGTVVAEVRIPDAVLSHPLLAESPLPAQPVTLVVVWEPSTDAISVAGTIGQVRFTAAGTAELASRTVALDIEIPPTSLASVVGIFGGAIPEAEGARLGGSLGLVARVEGPPWSVDPEPAAEDLSAVGVLPQGFRSRMVQWQARDANGFPTVRQIGPSHPGWTPLGAAGHMPAAVVAAEDGAFHTHPGYDLGAIREALAQARAGERLRGGSTLTQQLAKNLFLTDERTLARKLRELLYALELEHSLPKPAVLALYLNVVEFGPGIHGLRAAADAYFLKRPSGLNLQEAAWLAGILPGPRSAHARARAGKARRARMKTVLDRMAARGAITEAQRDRAKAAPLRFVLE